MRFTLSVRSFQVPATPRTCAWPPSFPSQLSFRADLAGHAGHLGRKRVQLIHHGVDGVFEFENFTLHIDGDLLRQVTERDGGGHLCDVSHLACQVCSHCVHIVRKVLPRPADAFHLGLPA
jgi:hypothetical protein